MHRTESREVSCDSATRLIDANRLALSGPARSWSENFSVPKCTVVVGSFTFGI